MKEYSSVVIVALVIAMYWIATTLYRRKLAHDLTASMVNEDIEKYRKILYSRRAILFLNPNVVNLFKATDQYGQGELELAEKTIRLVQYTKLSTEHLVNYFQLRSMICLDRQDGKEYKELREEIKGIRNEQNAEAMDAMLKENLINDRLHFHYDVSVIKDLRELIQQSDESIHGTLLFSLAKAYHLNGQDKEAKDALLKAKEKMVGTVAEELIDSALIDIRILDN